MSGHVTSWSPMLHVARAVRLVLNWSVGKWSPVQCSPFVNAMSQPAESKEAKPNEDSHPVEVKKKAYLISYMCFYCVIFNSVLLLCVALPRLALQYTCTLDFLSP